MQNTNYKSIENTYFRYKIQITKVSKNTYTFILNPCIFNTAKLCPVAKL